jgi:pimeloyl-ACP methyl ester carboxylesterase
VRHLGAQTGGTDEYLSGFWTHAERDLDGALNDHFGLLLHEERYGDAEFCAQLRAWQRGMDADGYVRQLKALARDYSTGDLLPSITADTLVVHGRQDRVEEEIRFLAAAIAGAGLALIEEAGHCTPIEQPQAFTAVMRLWLTRSSRRVVEDQAEGVALA